MNYLEKLRKLKVKQAGRLDSNDARRQRRELTSKTYTAARDMLMVLENCSDLQTEGLPRRLLREVLIPTIQFNGSTCELTLTHTGYEKPFMGVMVDWETQPHWWCNAYRGQLECLPDVQVRNWGSLENAMDDLAEVIAANFLIPSPPKGRLTLPQPPVSADAPLAPAKRTWRSHKSS